MSKFKHYITAPTDQIDEATYEGNIGFEEMVDFYKKSTESEYNSMEDAISRNDWVAFKKLIKRVVGVNLK
jgi:enolase